MDGMAISGQIVRFLSRKQQASPKSLEITVSEEISDSELGQIVSSISIFSNNIFHKKLNGEKIVFVKAASHAHLSLQEALKHSYQWHCL